MNFVVDKIIDLIKLHTPLDADETMIRIDGFENICIYEKLARGIIHLYENSELVIDIKLAKSKWNYFSKSDCVSSVLQSMEQNNWVAKEESITHYRNLHQANILVLMGTEDEEDKGGLLNCFTITPDTLIGFIKGKYHLVFEKILEYLDEDEYQCINNLYKDLFEFVAIDICKLSDFADAWRDHISSIDEFIELFYLNLPEWGIPYRKIDLPSSKYINGKKNILRVSYNFISRTMFKKLSATQYKKYQNQIIRYKELEKEYSTNWEGWNDQKIKSYSELAKILEGYIRGENITEYRNLLLGTDFAIIEAILDIKLPTESKRTKKAMLVINGEPLKVFITALLYALSNIKNKEKIVSKIIFKIDAVEIANLYFNSGEEDEKRQLQQVWSNICRHTNGVFKYLKKVNWELNGLEIEINCVPSDIFNPSKVVGYIEDGVVKAVNTNKSISKICFLSQCYDEDGILLEDESQDFQWKFDENSGWLHFFSDVCQQKFDENKYIPIATIKKLPSLLFAKSENEFFDIYNENKINFQFNLIDFVNEKAIVSARNYSVMFDELGVAFAEFLYEVNANGFYNCIRKEDSKLLLLLKRYKELGNFLLKYTIPENQKWILDAFIHAFNIEENTMDIVNNEDIKCCIVPPWHPATLQKLNDQKVFFLDGCLEWWRKVNDSKKNIQKRMIDEVVSSLMHMSTIRNSLDIFPSYEQQYFGSVNSFMGFSLYGRNDIKNYSRLKDIIHKDAIFDDDFDNKEISQMNDNACMIYEVIHNYVKSFPNTVDNLSIVFINPSELQPIIASIYKYVEIARKKVEDSEINIKLKILVKPKNKGGRNYLSYWMNEFFSQDSDVNIKTYLNEWKTKEELDKFLNGSHDIVFVMDLLKVNNLQFIKDASNNSYDVGNCLFPIVYKPLPVSNTTIKRKIEISQPQFDVSYVHTQVVRYRNNLELLPENKYIVVKEVYIDKKEKDMLHSLHNKAYWVVCIDSGIDGAILRNNEIHKNEYSVIGFSTGKGEYGQYNLTITARESILNAIETRFRKRLFQLFKWEHSKICKATKICIKEANGLNGISLLSAINQKDYNINEYMAYVLTVLREKQVKEDSVLKIMIHLDSYKHWFMSGIEEDIDDSMSRPDFLVLKVENSDDEKLHLKATIIECKISRFEYASRHKDKAIQQVEHGLRKLSERFNPCSKSIKRRYWFAQLYRALVFAQVTFSNDSSEFIELSTRLRRILDEKFEIEWNGKVLGYWLDGPGEEEGDEDIKDKKIKIYDIPQKCIQKILLKEEIDDVDFIKIDEECVIEDSVQEEQIIERENEITKELEDDLLQIQNNSQKIISKKKDNNDSFHQKQENVSMLYPQKNNERNLKQNELEIEKNIKESFNNTEKIESESSNKEDKNVNIEMQQKKKISRVR